MRKRQRKRFALVLLAAGAVLSDRLDGQQGDTWAADGADRKDMPTARRLLAAAAVGDRIYTFGGCGSPCFQPPLHTSTFEETRVEAYDLGTKRWTVEEPMPTILFGAAAAAPGNGKIYTFGGQVSGDVVQEYDPRTKTWSLKRPMPTPRYGLAAVPYKGKVYVLGGSGPSGALEVYDPAADTWEPGAPMTTPRVFLAAVAVDDRIYAIGGSPDCCGGSQTNAVEIYDPATDSWRSGPPLPVAQQVSAAVAANGRIYVFGGFVPGFGVQSATWELDPKAGGWTSRAALPMARDQSAAAFVGQTAVVLGGAVSCHCRALPRTDVYTPPPPPPVPTPSRLRISKSDGRDSVSPGDQVTYRIAVANEGGEAVSARVVDWRADNRLERFRWCRGDGCEPRHGRDLVETVLLPAGGAAVFTVAGFVPCGLAEVKNQACVEGAGTVVCASDTDRVLPPRVDLSIAKTDGLETAPPSSELTYLLTIGNRGLCDARGVTVADRLPEALLEPRCLGENRSDCVLAGGRDLSIRFDVPAGGAVAYRVSGRVSAAFSGILSNTAVLTAPAGISDPDPSNDSATDETAVDAPPPGPAEPIPAADVLGLAALALLLSALALRRLRLTLPSAGR